MIITREYLDEHVVKQVSRGTKCICPACGGNDLWNTSEYNGRVHCFNCSQSFRVPDVDYEEYIPPQPHPNIEGFRRYYETVSKIYHSCLSKEHEDYLDSRGLDTQAIENFELGFCPPTELSLYDDPISVEAGVARKDKKPILEYRITFPYRSDRKVTDLRGRIFRVDGMKYKGLFSSSVRRGSVYPFNYDRALEKAKEQKYLIITEGEMKAILADLHGFPCVAMPGMTNFRPVTVPAEWRLIVLFDNSKNPIDRFRVDKAIERVHMKLPKALVATLPLEKEEKQDIDSFLLGKGDRTKWFQHVIDDALPYETYKKYRRF